MDLDRPIGRPAAATPAEGDGLVAPIGRADREPKSRGVGVAAGAGAVIALVAVAAAGGWYVMRDRGGTPELAPGQPTTTVATAPLTTTPAPQALPKVDLPPTAAAQQRAEMARAEPAPPPARTERRAGARARPASSTSAAASGEDASATLPDAPQPYTALNPGATPAPVNPSPAAPTQSAPTSGEPIPSTPPTAPEASPPSTPQEQPPATVTPPPQP